MLQRKSVLFAIGEAEHVVDVQDIGPETTLNTYLREKTFLTGTKRMCLEGGCGACTVAVEAIIRGKKKVFSVNSCLVSILSCHGWKIHTIEGIGNSLMGYHEIQKNLSENYGTQCGFCSPGMVMNMFALQESGQATKEHIENSFGGNICRCTGYRPILHGFKKLASGSNEIKLQGEEIPDIEELQLCSEYSQKNCTKSLKKPKKNFLMQAKESKWIRVHTLQDLLEVLKISDVKNYMLVSGNTSRGVFKDTSIPDLYIDIKDTFELIEFSGNGDMLNIGGNVNLTDFADICLKMSENKKFSYLKQIVKHIDLVATVQIRNVGSIAGNLMMKYQHNEFQSDIFLLLETFNATIVIVDVDSNEIFVSPQAFLKTDMKKKVIKNIVFNALDDSYVFSTFKIMPRAQNAHAMVNAGFLIKLLNGTVKLARIIYGGINPKFIHATQTEKMLIGKQLYDETVLQNVFESLDEEINPDYVLPDPTPGFRKNLAISLFYKFVLKTCPPEKVNVKYRSGGDLFNRPLSTGTQEFGTDKKLWPLTQPIPKLESLAQSSGQMEYIMDMPKLPKEVHAALVTAKAPAGSKILSIETSTVLKLPGVIAFFDKKDIPGRNVFTPLDSTMYFSVEEELFCSGIVQYYNQVIGIIIAKTEEIAWKAADLVEVKYAPPTNKAYLDVREVVADNITNRITHISTLLPKEKGKDIIKVIKGDFYIGMQYHYHMELQSCKVVPLDDGGIDIFSTTQWMDANQQGASTVLNMPTNKINIKVRRLGGGFGAKILRNTLISTATALAAVKLQVPVNMILPLESNMDVLGKRYPLFTKYEVGVNASGVIQYLEAELYSDMGIGGNEPFESLMVASFQNCYDSRTWEFSTYAVKTDMHANCYTRAPGTVEGTAAIEAIMEHIALTMNLDPIEVKLSNTNTQLSPDMPNYFTNLKTWANIDARRADIEFFNKANRWRKRGLSVVPLRWVLEVYVNYTVIVSIYHGDGGVAISHGGVEMGQGINTKVIQVCAYKFGIDVSKVSVKPNYNFVAPNCSSSGGSLTSEAICYAVIRACDTLLERMKPIKDKMKNPTWVDVVNACFDAQIQLCATGYFNGTSPGIVSYPIFGICATSVEVDILTGQQQILQVDIIEDLGQSMSPLIDIGQIEGAFVMGIGYYTTEELIYDSEGKLMTNRTWTYKPPGAKDIPINFRIKFTENSENPVGVLKSKAVGEPPICLSIAVPLAIRNALSFAKKETNPTNTDWIPFDGPTTVEKTFLYAKNNYKQYVLH
ncbi:xanthine dehydrogenase-like isoform X1 [Diorhabda sublineata]|uniref:xanthine dehydrogenase-like isoform X1 n=1 Tax=Diorhabda sublineata TaxID=1163346 RepID=UPI0024E132EA|nr:xanthine dehydrogenase-like isoform X1 [Diorhabda sublineata]